jgi:hypothetical protein
MQVELEEATSVYFAETRTNCLHAIIRLYYLIFIHDSVPAEVWTGHKPNTSQNHYKLR